MGVDIEVCVKRKELEKLLEGVIDTYELEDLIFELSFFLENIHGRRWYNIEEFVEEEDKKLNNENFPKFIMYWYDDSITELEDEIREEIEERENKDLLYYFYRAVARKYRELIKGLVIPFSELKLSYYLFNDFEEYDKKEFVNVREALGMVAEKYYELLKKEKVM
jgi:hypothetical protein